ncbi:MAG: hypothetical protein ACJBCI_06760, partial [Candidatus Tisiphia sp.]
QATRIEKCGVIDTSSIRDHRGIRITDHKLTHCKLQIRQDKNKVKFIEYRDYSKFNLQEALRDVAALEWDNLAGTGAKCE